MHTLQSIDEAVFRLINQGLSNRFFDWLMPFLSGNPFFVPLLLVVSAGLIWKGGVRGRLCLCFFIVTLVLGNSLICAPLKQAVGRPRPFTTLTDTRLRVGAGGSGSMPSSHAANWWAGALVAGLYFRRSLWITLPLAASVSFSRIYVGVHYPSDVLVGAALGVTYAAAIVCGLNALSQRLGQRWFPLWHAQLPSLLKPELRLQPTATQFTQSTRGTSDSALDLHWLRLGYLLIGLLLLVRLAYLASGKIELSEDEAYQWLWSKHLALSYYSKPPMIAYTQFLGTTLWGDNAFGVRFFSPIIGALVSVLLLRFLAHEVNVRAGFWLVMIVTATPLMAIGAILMTIDPLSVLFWTAAVIAGWRAVKMDSTRHWLWTGLWIGLGLLSKYTALFQWLCWAVFFVLWPPARKQWLRPGPYLALMINLLCLTPVLIWNYQHGWITVTHVASNAALDRAWQPSLRYFLDFVAAETALLNPVFFFATIAAAILFWRLRPKDPLLVYLFGMGAPLFLVYLFYTVRARVQPNWIAPSVLPLFCLLVIYWESRWRAGVRLVQHWLSAGMGFGLAAVVLLYDTNLIQKLAGKPLPPGKDPLRRVRAWTDMAREVGAARAKLLKEGKPVFIIGDHYGTTALISFYLPEAKARVPTDPLVFCQSSDRPQNQFYFWPGYRERHKGENAIYVRQVDSPESPPERLQSEFALVQDAGLRTIVYRGRDFHTIQIFECRNLR